MRGHTSSCTSMRGLGNAGKKYEFKRLGERPDRPKASDRTKSSDLYLKLQLHVVIEKTAMERWQISFLLLRCTTHEISWIVNIKSYKIVIKVVFNYQKSVNLYKNRINHYCVNDKSTSKYFWPNYFIVIKLNLIWITELPSFVMQGQLWEFSPKRRRKGERPIATQTFGRRWLACADRRHTCLSVCLFR